MLVNMKPVLAWANENNCAVGAFNCAIRRDPQHAPDHRRGLQIVPQAQGYKIATYLFLIPMLFSGGMIPSYR